MAIPEDLVTPARAAELVGVTRSSIYRWVASGKIKAWRRGEYLLLLSERDVRAMLRPVDAGKPPERLR